MEFGLRGFHVRQADIRAVRNVRKLLRSRIESTQNPGLGGVTKMIDRERCLDQWRHSEFILETENENCGVERLLHQQRRPVTELARVSCRPSDPFKT